VARSMSTAPLNGGAHPGRRPGEVVRGLMSGVLLLGIVLGIPAALVVVVGNPIPEIPRDPLGGQVPIEFVLDVIVCIVWLAWAQLVSCLLVELVAGVRGSGLPWRVPFAAAAQQDLARRLITAVLLLATAGHGLQSAHAPGGPHLAAPAAVSTVSGTLDQVAVAAVGQADAAARQADVARTAPAGSEAAGSLHGAKQYVVMPPQGRHHDSLWDISERYLGSGTRYREVFALNEGRVQPDGSKLTLESLIRPGWTLVLPADARGEGLIEVTPDLAGQTDAAVAAQVGAGTVSGTAHGGTDVAGTQVGGGQVGGGRVGGVPAGSVASRLPSSLPAPGVTPGPLAGASALSGSGSLTGSPVGSGPLAHAGTTTGSGSAPGTALPGTGSGGSFALPAPGGGNSALPGPLAGAAGHRLGGEAQAPEQTPQIPWDLVGAELLAAGVLEVLVALRRRRAATRRANSTVPLPDAEAAAAEVAVRLGADPAAADFLDRALRTLARTLAEHDRPAPEVYAARLSTEALELLLAVPQDQAPAPFVAENNGSRWVLDRSIPLPATDGVAAPLPGLVSLGGDGHGRVFVDLESAGGAICVAGDLDRARSVVAAAAVELVTNRWSDDIRVTLVGFGAALAPISEQRLRCVDSLDEVVEGVTDRLSAGRQELTASGIDSVLTGRVRGLRGDGVTPDFLVLANPPAPEQLAELQDWARSARRAPLGILIAGEVPTARWRFEIDDRGMLDTGVLGVTVGAQLLTARSYAALARLIRSEVAAAEPAPAVPAPVWAPVSAVVEAPVEQLSLPVPPRPIDPDREPAVLLRIFGEPAVDGTERLLPGTPLALEIAGYLALTGGVTPRALAASVWPYGVTVAERDATLARVGDWLGTDAAGQPRLRLDEDGRLRLSQEVQLDWHLFLALAGRGDESDVLQALELARGPLLEPHLPRRYTWVARDAVSRQLPEVVTDVAHRAAVGYRGAGRLDGAIAAARAGLRVEPASGVLWDDLVEAVRDRDGEAAAHRTLADKAAALTPPTTDPGGIAAPRLTA
jgi:LysM domain